MCNAKLFFPHNFDLEGLNCFFKLYSKCTGCKTTYTYKKTYNKVQLLNTNHYLSFCNIIYFVHFGRYMVLLTRNIFQLLLTQWIPTVKGYCSFFYHILEMTLTDVLQLYKTDTCSQKTVMLSIWTPITYLDK